MAAKATKSKIKGSQSNKKVLSILEEIFSQEMAGIARYLHYSFMIMGHNRIPIQKWFRDQANEAMAHSVLVGEKITSLGGHPSLVAAEVKETNLHSIDAILEESLEFEHKALELYKKLAKEAGSDIALEEFARGFVKQETEHIDEVLKMLART